ncbi:radical SAM protein [Streptomyces sp. NBC_01465]|uniref:radical SAM protein n=1 Tax=Streptomyces sp. NBC_01465 TaxID=2903878 RepID=UPI002E369107|nr:radical SAM protein [Streptomyces sp. NBC_01465]
MEILRHRPVPASAVFFGITRRCPLHCKHCSTSSMLDSEEYPEEMFRRFATTFTTGNRPEFVLMSGGEALLRPRLVKDVADISRAVGARSHILSGLYFAAKDKNYATTGRIPRSLRPAIDAVDHFSASLDFFHEEEVPRKAVFRVLRELLEEGKHVSLQLTGTGPDDPYLEGLTAEVRREFDDRVPMLVAPVSPHGRADAWLLKQVQLPRTTVDPAPCSVSAWPVIGFNGQVTACGNQDVMDGKVPLPPHLYLGHINKDDWSVIRERSLNNPMVRAIRATGPEYLAERYGSGKPGCAAGGYCETCWVLSKDEAVPRAVRAAADRESVRLVEKRTEELLVEAGPLTFAKQYGITRYAELVTLGDTSARSLV